MRYILLFAGLMCMTGLGWAEPAGQADMVSGKVIATTNAADYTYIQVDTGAKKVWAAAPRFEVKVGDTASFTDRMPMPKFHSKALNRDFDVVYFTAGVVVNGVRPGAGGAMGALPPNHPAIAGGTAKGGLGAGLPPNHPAVHGTPAVAAGADFSGLKKAKGGKTVEEIIANRVKLKGQEVTVRGKVVRYNAMILGKNWVHIQDGTGSEGQNDLLVTTTATAKVGDTVLVMGKVATDRDFGFNYKYAVMLEDAKVVVE